MNKYLHFIFLTTLIFVLISPEIFPQAEFNTGNIGINVNTYGRIRIFTPATSGTRHIDRLSILLGTAPNQVFDYQNDAENEEPTTLISSPALSDYEIYGAYNNTFSNLPPNILQRLYVYGWTNGAYSVVKNIIKNREASPINAIFGLDIVTQLLGSYGMDTVEFISSDNIIDMYKNNIHVGLKFLSHNLTSLTSFEWYSGYYVDTSYYNWLTHGVIDPVYYGGVEGPVVIPALSLVPINPGDSVSFWFALAVGTTRQEMLANMQQAETKYNLIVPVELISFTASADKRKVMLNWQTATELNNFGFEIERKINSDWVTIGFREGFGTTTEIKSYSFIDDISGIQTIKIRYRLKQIDFNGRFSYSDEVEAEVLPLEYSLNQNFPNPFNPSTVISFSIPEKEFVSLKIFNLLGQEITSLVSEVLDSGNYNIEFDAGKISTGIYIYTLSAGKFKESKKMLLVR